MSAIRSTGGKTEVALRSVLHRRGLRFRKNCAKLTGKPDIVFPGPRVAVFIDGDYWHARVLREKGPEALYARIKTANRDYWIDKFTKRMKRDDEVTAALREEGWTVLRFWESDVRRDLAAVADVIESAVAPAFMDAMADSRPPTETAPATSPAPPPRDTDPRTRS